jgi:hypothetical protein
LKATSPKTIDHMRVGLPTVKATQLADSYWLYVVWSPLDNPDPEPLRIQNPAKHLDHAKREIIAARYYDIPADAIEGAAKKQRGQLD